MKTITTLLVISTFLSAFNLAHAAPTITVQPQSRTNNVGDNAQFTVTATGSGTLTYQWQFNNVDIVGATSSTLNRSVSDTNMAGNYHVLVIDDSGTNTSSDAVLSIPYSERTKITQWNSITQKPLRLVSAR